MTLLRLLLRNLFYHWRGNLAVFLGVAVGTAVLTGALLVGDSLRGSLRELALQRLGWVDQALVSGRLVREQLADSLDAERVCPAILLQGSASALADEAAPPFGQADTAQRRAGKVVILGVDERFWPEGSAANRAFWRADEIDRGGVVLSAALARELNVGPGGKVVLQLQKSSAVPRESLLGRRTADDLLAKLTLPVRAVLPDDSFGSRFSLIPSPTAPRNAFVPLRILQARLEPERRPGSRRPQPLVNALLVQGGNPAALEAQLHSGLKLEDWGLILRNRSDRGYLSLESRQLLLEPAVVTTALKTARELDLRPAPTLVYLANRISNREAQVPSAVAAALQPWLLGALPPLIYVKQEIPYSVVAALDPAQAPPLGPFLPAGAAPLKDDEILLADWKGSPLQARPGDMITLTYFNPEDQGGLKERTATFRLRGLVPLEGVAADAGLTPEFPGITDKLNIGDWDPPFPFENRRVGKQDEAFWKQYRATPKAYVTLAAGQRLWGSRFGQLTSLRLAPANGRSDLAATADQFRNRLLAHLDPRQGGLVFDTVRQRSLEASVGGTDFSELFLGFSVFLIIAALLLVGLLFRLNLDRRAREIGLLLAAGYRRGTVRWLLLAEGGLLAAAGAVVGLGGAVLYAWLLLGALGNWWPGALAHSFLRLHVTVPSLLIGYFAALVVSVLTIAWAVRILGRVSPRALLAGETTAESDAGLQPRPSRWSLWIAGGSALGAIGLLIAGGFVRDHEMQAMTFFGGGMLLLTAALCGAWAWMRGSRHGRVRGQGRLALARLGVRNAARHPVRSLLTAGLLASAAFLIVAVESFRRQPSPDYLDVHSGSGGFALLAEADLPVYHNLNRVWQQAVTALAPSGAQVPLDPNRDKGEDELADKLETEFHKRLSEQGAAPTAGQLETLQAAMREVAFYPFRVRAGDDASCLNLYQPRRPRLLGVPPTLIQRGGFHWAESEAKSSEELANPWLLLDKPLPDGAIPVVGEKNTVLWMLKSGLGKDLEVPNERGEPVKLRIVGLLQDSVFQSELLMSEANFLRLYPAQEGYQFFLIQTPPGRSADVEGLLETTLADRGFDATPAAQRLQAFLAVENTYLSTFQALGGLGLLLGALGLAVVLLRSVWERRGELALLRALGFRKSALAWLVLAENGFLLILGLGVGTLAALLAVAPHLTGGGEVPWLTLLGLLGLVLLVGLAAGVAAVAATLRAPLVPALRHE